VNGAALRIPLASGRRVQRAALGSAIRDQGLVAAGQGLSGLGNLLFALVAARMLQPGEFAQLAALLALYLLLHLPAGSLSAGSALRPELSVALCRRVLAIGTAVGAAVLVVGLPLAGSIGLSAGLVVCLAAAAPAAGLLALQRGRHYEDGHRRLVASLGIEPVVRLTIGVALMAAFGPVGAAVGVLLAGYAALVVASGGRRADPERGAAAAAVGAGRDAPGDAPPVASRALGVNPMDAVLVFLFLALIQNEDLLLANALLEPGEAGRFAAISTLGGIAAFATATVPLVLLPRAASGAPYALSTALGAAAALGGGALLLVGLAPDTVVSFLFGDRYAPVAGVAVPYLLAMALLGVARVLAAHASATGAGRSTLAILGGAVVVHVVLVVLIGSDAEGIATATLASTALLAAALGGAAALRLPAVRLQLDHPWALFVRSHAPEVALLTVGALGLRLLVTRGLWLDEATTWYQASLPSLGIMLDDIRSTDVHPPLHHVISWFAVRAFGDGELALRMPSMAAGVALVPALYATARELWDSRTGLIVASLATAAPILVWYSQEARMYSLLLLFGVLAAWAQARALRTGSPYALVAYGAASAAVIYTQYFGVFLVIALQIAFLAGALRRRRELDGSPRPLMGLAAATLVIALLVIPLVPFALDQFAANEAAGRGFEQPSQAGGDVSETGNEISAYAAITNVVWALWGYHAGDTMASVGALWPLGLLLMLVLLGRGSSPATRLVATAALLPPVLLTVIATQKPFLFELRYALPAVPFLVLLGGRALASWPRGRRASTIAAVLATVTLLIGLADQQLNGTNPRFYDFEGALSEVSDRAGKGDVLLYQPAFLDNVIRYYEPGIEARPLNLERLPEPERGQRVYVVGSFFDKPGSKQAIDTAVERLGNRADLTNRTRRSQVRVWEFSR
jgi:Dolichyl-phosphate-mannose-protein mannosyltransferase